MTARSKRRIKKILLGILLLYIIGGVVLYLIQDLLLFHPRPLNSQHQFNFSQPFEERQISYGKEHLSLVVFKPRSPRKGIVLFFHGNMNNVEHYKKYPELFTRNGWELWMPDYPGFGKSTGKRSERILYDQALLLYALAAKESSADSILIYGKSIGTGIASYLASVRKSRKLVLETPYYNVQALINHYFPIYPFGWMSRYRFTTNEYLRTAMAPVLAFHGTSDEIIPYRQATRLQREHPKMELVTIEGGMHNNLFEFRLYQQKMDSLLATPDQREQF